MTIKKIFVISGVVRYEGSDPIKSATTKEKAEQLIKDIKEYNIKKPDDEYEESKEFKEWEKGHPAGEYGNIYDYYKITEVDIL